MNNDISNPYMLRETPEEDPKHDYVGEYGGRLAKVEKGVVRAWCDAHGIPLVCGGGWGNVIMVTWGSVATKALIRQTWGYPEVHPAIALVKSLRAEVKAKRVVYQNWNDAYNQAFRAEPCEKFTEKFAAATARLLANPGPSAIGEYQKLRKMQDDKDEEVARLLGIRQDLYKEIAKLDDALHKALGRLLAAIDAAPLAR